MAPWLEITRCTAVLLFFPMAAMRVCSRLRWQWVCMNITSPCCRCFLLQVVPKVEGVAPSVRNVVQLVVR